MDSNTIASKIGEIVGNAWNFITEPANLQLVIGIVIIVVVAQFLFRGSSRVLDTIFMCVAVLFALYFVFPKIGIQIDVFGIISSFIEFVKKIWASVANAG
ncbi:MAG: hypothetical protein RR415_09370 [Ruthenibacterium sp.]